MASRASLLVLRDVGSSGEWGRFLGCEISAPLTEALFPLPDRLGLYEQSWGCSRLTQFSHGLWLSHLTFLWRHGQQAVPRWVIKIGEMSYKKLGGGSMKSHLS